MDVWTRVIQGTCVNLRLMDKVFEIKENLRAEKQNRRNQFDIDYLLPINCNL
jgi:hypothetical protein